MQRVQLFSDCITQKKRQSTHWNCGRDAERDGILIEVILRIKHFRMTRLFI